MWREEIEQMKSLLAEESFCEQAEQDAILGGFDAAGWFYKKLQISREYLEISKKVPVEVKRRNHLY